jgi:hypothetical protein
MLINHECRLVLWSFDGRHGLKPQFLHDEHFKYYSDFINIERVNDDDTQSLTELDNLLKKSTVLQDLVNT